jgi:hypothetical protein
MCRRWLVGQHVVDTVPVRTVESSGGRRLRVRRFRRLAYSLGWLAALVLAAGAGWKTS